MKKFVLLALAALLAVASLAEARCHRGGRRHSRQSCGASYGYSYQSYGYTSGGCSGGSCR